MTFHRVMLIKCNGEGCSQAHITDTPMQDPEGWVSDGTQHLCPECQQKRDEPQVVESEPA